MRPAVHSTDLGTALPRVDFHAWTNDADFASGRCDGVAITAGDRRGLAISDAIGVTEYRDSFRNASTRWAYGTWTSPIRELDFGATRMIMSWNGHVPLGTYLSTEIQAFMANGEITPWLPTANYAFFDADIARTSVCSVSYPHGEVDTDTFLSYQGSAVHAYRLRLTLCQTPGTTASPRIGQIAMLASNIQPRRTVQPSAPGPASEVGIELSVPPYSQRVHDDHYQQFDGGGKSWCSATCTQMVTEYWGMRIPDADLAWIAPECQEDPQVIYAARHIYDYQYRGTGNWAFNAAYSSHFGLDAEVTQLPSMAHLEQLIRHGIPVITAQSFDLGEIAGADYKTAGHLWVVTGFTTEGDVIVNDPARLSNSQVRCVFNRRQFENVWLRTFWDRADGSIGYSTGGVVYIIKDRGLDPPSNLDPANRAWRE